MAASCYCTRGPTCYLPDWLHYCKECLWSGCHCVQEVVPPGVPFLQSGAIDAQAMVMALAMCLVRPLAKLNRHKPSERMCTLPVLALLAMMAIGLALLDTGYMAFLIFRPWFVGGTGNSNKVS